VVNLDASSIAPNFPEATQESDCYICGCQIKPLDASKPRALLSLSPAASGPLVTEVHLH
jgi:hypothetical protein